MPRKRKWSHDAELDPREFYDNYYPGLFQGLAKTICGLIRHAVSIADRCPAEVEIFYQAIEDAIHEARTNPALREKHAITREIWRKYADWKAERIENAKQRKKDAKELFYM